jgi:hypothetical protein
MAKAVTVRLGDESSSFAFAKLDREKLYGRKERQVIDPDGGRCTPAWLSSDGVALVPPGGVAMLFVDDAFLTIERSSLKAVDATDTELPVKPSTLGVEQVLEAVDAATVLDHCIATVYVLAPETLGPTLAAELAAGKIFRAPFNYRDDTMLETMFLVRNEAGIFALVGRPHGYAMVAKDAAPATAEEEHDDLGDDLDFSMTWRGSWSLPSSKGGRALRMWPPRSGTSATPAP